MTVKNLHLVWCPVFGNKEDSGSHVYAVTPEQAARDWLRVEVPEPQHLQEFIVRVQTYMKDQRRVESVRDIRVLASRYIGLTTDDASYPPRIQ